MYIGGCAVVGSQWPNLMFYGRTMTVFEPDLWYEADFLKFAEHFRKKQRVEKFFRVVLYGLLFQNQFEHNFISHR